MIFAPDLAQKILDGEKTVTRRLPSDNPRSPWWRERCAFKVGRTYAICPGRTEHAIGRMRIVKVDLQPLVVGWKNQREAEREGFDTPESLHERWAQMHGAVAPRDLVWRVEFDLAEATDG